MKKLDIAISIASNTIGSPTGYGMQAQLLAERLIAAGAHVANLSNYGLEGGISDLEVAGTRIPHYPRGYSLYSEDVLGVWHAHHAAKYPGKPNAILGLYDVWVWNAMQYDGDFLAWVPLDHVTLPPGVEQFLRKENVTAITMSPHGQRQLDAAGIENTYIPHAIDTKIMKPTPEAYGQPTREFMNIAEDDFLVGMVAANKANGGFFHRKAFAENLLAFSIFAKDKPDAKIYLHTEPSAIFGGFNLPILMQACGIKPEQVILPEPIQQRIGYPHEVVAAFYTAFDVLLATNYGEGFGVPQLEAMACGTRIITSDFAASADICSPDSYRVTGQPFWDEKQAAFFQIPHIPSIVAALERAYENRGHSEESLKFAQGFDADYVFKTKWVPFLEKHFK